MIPTSFDLATITLVEVNGKQEIRIIPKESVDLSRCLQTLFSLSNQNITTLPAHFGDYFESLLSELKLPVAIYRQKTYNGLRSLSSNETLVYWNYNFRVKYLNVSVKTSLLEKLPVEHSFSFDTDKRFPRTQRVRLHSVSQVDEFFPYLSLVLTSVFVLP
jgi:Leucine-rich repeat (LRR) protein